VLEGLDADERGDAARARGRYERALQIDASNPWAYLSLARHYVEMGEPGAALSHLDRAEALFEAQEIPPLGRKSTATDCAARHSRSRATRSPRVRYSTRPPTAHPTCGVTATVGSRASLARVGFA
jgi:tetratricopeptide (TPR) repeat protein